MPGSPLQVVERVRVDRRIALGLGPLQHGRRQRAEVNLRVPGDTLHAQCYAQDLYAAVDMVVEKLDRQMDRYKGKLRDHDNLAAKRIQPSA